MKKMFWVESLSVMFLGFLFIGYYLLVNYQQGISFFFIGCFCIIYGFVRIISRNTLVYTSKLTSYQLVQVDATIIAGLIILLTIQSISSPVYSKQINDVISSIHDSMTDAITTENLMKEYCMLENTKENLFLHSP